MNELLKRIELLISLELEFERLHSRIVASMDDVNPNIDDGSYQKARGKICRTLEMQRNFEIDVYMDTIDD